MSRWALRLAFPQVIATTGQTGRASASHLHFETRVGGPKCDPLLWLPPPGAVEVAAGAPRPHLAAP